MEYMIVETVLLLDQGQRAVCHYLRKSSGCYAVLPAGCPDRHWKSYRHGQDDTESLAFQLSTVYLNHSSSYIILILPSIIGATVLVL